MTSKPAAALSLRREAGFVLAIAILLLSILSIVTLATHRSALDTLRAEQISRWRRDVATLARRVDAGVRPADLVAQTPGLLDLERSRVDSVDDEANVPEGDENGAVRLSARLSGGEFLIATFEGGSLWRELRRVRMLSPIVVGAAAGAALILLLYARRLLSPYDRLLQSARAAGYESSADEIGFLVATFEQAVAEAARLRQDEGVASDLGALESALGATLPRAALLLDAGHRVLSANPAARAVLAPAEIELDQPLERSGLPEALLAAVRELSSQDPRAASRGPLEVLLPAPVAGARSGHRRLEVDLRPLRTGPDEGRAKLLLIADVTEARQLAERERLDESLRRVGEVAAGLAHELRNGLATIQGYASLVIRRSTGGDLDDLKALSREATHLERVVADFLLFARPGHARTERFDLRELLQRAAEDPALGVAVALAPGQAVFLQADRLLIDRAVRNLLRNASEAERSVSHLVPEPVVVTVDRTLGGKDSGWTIAIRDHGPGWPPLLRERLGEAFVSQRPGGVGLGLALAQRVARLHGGDLEFVDPPRGGAEVRLHLPAGLEAGQFDTTSNNLTQGLSNDPR